MLKEKISQNLKDALKAVSQADSASEERGKRELEVSVLRQLSAAVFNKEKEKRYKISKEGLQDKELEKQSAFSDDEVVEAILSEIKKEKEALILFEKGKREDLIRKATAEIEILEKYLPEQLSEEELEKLIEDAIEKIGAKEIQDMGKVMAELMPKIKGKADTGRISKIVKDLLASPQKK